MRAAITGTTGRVGAALAQRLTAQNHEVIALPRRVFDLENPQEMAAVLADLRCDVFFHPAAVTSLEACEDDPHLAQRINVEAPAEIAAWAAVKDVKLVHFSTDYVFGGETSGLRGESDPAQPLSEYGRTKLAGERAVLAHPCHCVVRVSWVFGPERPSFVDGVFDAALAGRPIAAVADKYSLPVFTRDLAAWSEVLATNATGMVHACQSGEPVSWHGMATAVVAEMAAAGVISELPTIAEQRLNEMTQFRAARPRFTAMATHQLTGLLGAPPRPWQNALAEYIRGRCSVL